MTFLAVTSVEIHPSSSLNRMNWTNRTRKFPYFVKTICKFNSNKQILFAWAKLVSWPFLISKNRRGNSEISFTKWLRGTKTVQLPVTFLMTCKFSHRYVSELFHIDMFPSLKNIQQDLPRSRRVMLKNSLSGKKMQTLKKDLLGLKISKKVSGRRAPRNQRNREDSSN